MYIFFLVSEGPWAKSGGFLFFYLLRGNKSTKGKKERSLYKGALDTTMVYYYFSLGSGCFSYTLSLSKKIFSFVKGSGLFFYIFFAPNKMRDKFLKRNITLLFCYL